MSDEQIVREFLEKNGVKIDRFIDVQTYFRDITVVLTEPQSRTFLRAVAKKMVSWKLHFMKFKYNGRVIYSVFYGNNTIDQETWDEA